MSKGTFTRELIAADASTTDHGIVDFPGLKRGDGAARIAVNIGYGFDYGKGKCSVTVSIACDQTEEMIDMAGDLAMHKADQLADEGMKIVDARLSE